jgi:hypothetical protein
MSAGMSSFDLTGRADRAQAERLVLAAELGELVVDERLHREQEERALAVEHVLERGKLADQGLPGRGRRADDEVLAVEQAEVVDGVLLQLVQRRDGLGPGVDELRWEPERVEAVDVRRRLRASTLGEGRRVALSGRKHRPAEAAVERAAQRRLLPRAELTRGIGDAFRHVLEQAVDRHLARATYLLGSLERLE